MSNAESATSDSSSDVRPSPVNGEATSCFADLGLPLLGIFETDAEALCCLAASGDASCQIRVNELVQRLLQGEQSSLTLFSMISACLYLDNIGNFVGGSELCDQLMPLVLNFGDINLERKLLNTSGVLAAHHANFEQSLQHFNTSLSIARKIGNPIYVFAVLSNVAGTLVMMGLNEEAGKLFSFLAEHPCETPVFAAIHLQNAINEAVIAERKRDILAYERCLEKARAALTLIDQPGDLWVAFVDVMEGTFLGLAGKPRLSWDWLTAKSALGGKASNPRISVMLEVARTKCAIDLSDQGCILEVRESLNRLYESTQEAFVQRDELLRPLIYAYEGGRSEQETRLQRRYTRELSDLIIHVKHRQFFDSVTKRARHAEVRLHPASYQIPQFWTVPDAKGAVDETPLKSDGLEVFPVPRFTTVNSLQVELVLRSPAYDVAEDWAIAADYFTGRHEQHSFRVGRLAALLIERLGASEQEVVEMELACRLHDIGKIGIDGDLQRLVASGRADEYQLREHVKIGADILGQSDDQVLRLARVIARHHHEWWNGCGYPDGLAGSDIPRAARICALADTYIGLLQSHWVGQSWDRASVARQLISMTGVQLDPVLVNTVLAMQDASLDWLIDIEEAGRVCCANNSLVDAKRRLMIAVTGDGLESGTTRKH